ncbi:hypothetical protein [Methylobacterium sp. GC_Met_2]|uniref:hypothetical protein n=1 Tax=Methylobacterium sp. GC_Met_2 TaxID=2937376 RepID=UPI00226BA0DC|nr:hypothetical protein [Methylobacterium sp. GC_Met_2]
MGDVLTFTPRPKPATPEALEPLAGPALRASLEEAAQTALDAADRIIAVLDSMNGDADDEDGADNEPSLAAPENASGSQVVYMRGSDWDGEAEAPQVGYPKWQSDPFCSCRGAGGGTCSRRLKWCSSISWAHNLCATVERSPRGDV